MKELGLVQNITSTNKTYIQVNKTNNQVISDQTRFLNKKCDLEEMKKIEHFLKPPGQFKLHKHSSKARFIIAVLQ